MADPRSLQLRKLSSAQLFLWAGGGYFFGGRGACPESERARSSDGAFLFEVAGEYGLAFAQSQAAGLGGDGVGILIEAVAVARRAGDGGGDDDGFASIADLVSGWVFDDFIGLAGALVQTFGIG